MRSGCVKTDNADFTGAQHDFEAALAEAQRLNDKEAQAHSYERLGSMLVLEGNFQKAEECARARIDLIPSEEAYSDLAWSLELQRRYDEAIPLRKQHYVSAAAHKQNKTMVPGIQTAIKREWHPKKTYNQAWTTTIFNVPSLVPSHTVAYISRSTGDKELDAIALLALSRAHLPQKLPSGEGNVAVLFTFRYNAFRGAYDPDQLTQHDIARTQYKVLRTQLEAIEKSLGADHIEYIAAMLAATDKFREIQPSNTANVKAYEHILNLCDSHDVKGSLLYSTLVGYGQALLAQQDFQKAEPVLARANKLKLELYSADSVFEPDPTQLLAKALTKLHRSAEAKALLSTLPKQ
jgi:tetratricopeptide (TPR) repeat protein